MHKGNKRSRKNEEEEDEEFTIIRSKEEDFNDVTDYRKKSSELWIKVLSCHDEKTLKEHRHIFIALTSTLEGADYDFDEMIAFITQNIATGGTRQQMTYIFDLLENWLRETANTCTNSEPLNVSRSERTGRNNNINNRRNNNNNTNSGRGNNDSGRGNSGSGRSNSGSGRNNNNSSGRNNSSINNNGKSSDRNGERRSTTGSNNRDKGY